MFGRRERRHGDANGAGTVPARFRRVPPSGPRGRTAKKNIRHALRDSISCPIPRPAPPSRSPTPPSPPPPVSSRLPASGSTGDRSSSSWASSRSQSARGDGGQIGRSRRGGREKRKSGAFKAGETTGRDPGKKTSGISAPFGRARALPRRRWRDPAPRRNGR